MKTLLSQKDRFKDIYIVKPLRDMEDKQGNSPFSKHLERAVFILISLLGFYLYLDQKNLNKEKDTLLEASHGELITWKNKNGENLAKIQVLETENINTLLDFKTKDSTIQELQKLVEENKKMLDNSKGTAGVIKSETEIVAEGKTDVAKDSITGDPIYKSKIENEWYTINSIATKDSTKVSLKSFHNLSLVIGEERKNIFSKPKTYAIAKDSNPYSNIKDMRIYKVTRERKRFSLVTYTGFGATLIEQNVKVGFQAGVGIAFTIIKF